MKTFTDINGHQWMIQVNIATVKRVKKLLDIDMLEIDSFMILLQDIITRCDILYVLCLEQANERGVS